MNNKDAKAQRPESGDFNRKGTQRARKIFDRMNKMDRMRGVSFSATDGRAAALPYQFHPVNPVNHVKKGSDEWQVMRDEFFAHFVVLK